MSDCTKSDGRRLGIVLGPTKEPTYNPVKEVRNIDPVIWAAWHMVINGDGKRFKSERKGKQTAALVVKSQECLYSASQKKVSKMSI